MSDGLGDMYDDYRTLLRRGLCPVHAIPMTQVMAHRPEQALRHGCPHRRIKIAACPNPACGFRGYGSILEKAVVLFKEYLFLLGAEPVRLDVTSNQPMSCAQWSADVAGQLVERSRAIQSMLTPNTLPWDPYVIAVRRTAAQMVSVAHRIEHDQRWLASRAANRRRRARYAQETSEATVRQATVGRAFFVQMRRLQDTVDHLIDDPEFTVDAWLEWFLAYEKRVTLSPWTKVLTTVLCSALRDGPVSLTVDYNALKQVWTLGTGLSVTRLESTLDELAASGCIERSVETVRLLQRPISPEALRWRWYGL